MAQSLAESTAGSKSPRRNSPCSAWHRGRENARQKTPGRIVGTAGSGGRPTGACSHDTGALRTRAGCIPVPDPSRRRGQQPGGMAAITQQQPERRARERVALRCAAYVFVDGVPGVIRATTTDISSCGLYCQSDVQVPKGERFRCLIEMTSNGFRPSNGSTCLECLVEVVRIEKRGSGFGMGCRIREYRLLRSEEPYLTETDDTCASA